MSAADTARMETDRTATEPEWPALDAMRAHLLAQKQAVDAEIRAYPPPIPACDAQFNHLLEQRTGLFRALRRLDALAARTLPRAERVRALAAFVASCAYVDDARAECIAATRP